MKQFDNGEDYRNRPKNKWEKGYVLEDDPQEISCFTYMLHYDLDFTWHIFRLLVPVHPLKRMVNVRRLFHPMNREIQIGEVVVVNGMN